MDAERLSTPELIAAICRGLGISQAELARRLGTYPPTVTRWARGYKPPLAVYRRELERLYREAMQAQRR